MNPELRDLTAKWTSYPPEPYTDDPNNLFEIEVVSGNGNISRVTLTRLQAAEVAKHICPMLDAHRPQCDGCGAILEYAYCTKCKMFALRENKVAADAAQEGEAKNG